MRTRCEAPPAEGLAIGTCREFFCVSKREQDGLEGSLGFQLPTTRQCCCAGSRPGALSLTS